MALSKKILLTGATGFVGTGLLPRLEELGHRVYPFARSLGHDVCKKASFDPFLNKGIDIVFHLAALTYVPESWEHTDAFYEVNTMGTQHALDFCRQTGAGIVFVSAYVYGAPQYLPVDEAHPVKPNNPYAHSKWLAEEICRFYSGNMGVKAMVLRPFNLYGPDQDSRFLIPTIIRQAREDGRIRVKDHTPRRDYLHLSDFVEACVLSMDHDGPFSVFNVGYGRSFSVAEIADMVVEACGGAVEWTSEKQVRRNEIPDTVADCRAIEQELGWRPTVSLASSLPKLMERGGY